MLFGAWMKSVTKRIALASVAGSLVSACTYQADILSAKYEETDTNEGLVSIEIPRPSAEVIKDWEIYFSIHVSECRKEDEGYPVEPFIERVRASEFSFSVAGDRVLVSGSIPRRVFEQFQHPCASLNGGSYMLRKMRSNEAPISEV
ncbi:MAG: hypothetical protein ABR601_07545 [Parasphingopyxis sp.]|nr:hypothetical protein [Sphingomonadales bacterium]